MTVERQLATFWWVLTVLEVLVSLYPPWMYLAPDKTLSSPAYLPGPTAQHAVSRRDQRRSNFEWR